MAAVLLLGRSHCSGRARAQVAAADCPSAGANQARLSHLWIRSFDTVEELRRALLGFRETYNATWLIERHGSRPPDAVRRGRLSPEAHAAQARARRFTKGDMLHGPGAAVVARFQAGAGRPR